MIVNLVWDAVTTDLGGGALTGLSGYRVFHGTFSGVYPDFVDVSAPTTTYTWTGLTDYQRHFFVVEAFDAVPNYSPVSNEVSKLGPVEVQLFGGVQCC